MSLVMNLVDVVGQLWDHLLRAASLAMALQVAGSVLSVAGAYITAKRGHTRKALRGWVIWLAAGVTWMAYCVLTQMWAMLCMHAFFFYTASVGFRMTLGAPKGVDQRPDQVSNAHARSASV